MNLLETLKTALRDLMLRTFRSALATLGIMFAVASVLTMISISDGGRRATLERISLLGVDNIILRTIKPPKDQVRQAGSGNEQQQRIMTYGLKRANLQHLRDSYPLLRYAVGVKNMRKEVHSAVLNQLMDLPVLATEPDYLPITRSKLIRGRYLHASDDDHFAMVCVLGKTAARKLFAWEEPVGQTLRIGNDWYDVVGVVENLVGLRDAGGDDINNAVFTPLRTITRRYGDFNIKVDSGSYEVSVIELDAIHLQLERENAVIPCSQRLQSYLSKTHTKQDYAMTVPLDLINQQEATQRIFTIVMASIAGISLLIGGIGIMNIMLANVSERRKEIGTRRALGARQIDIIQQFLVESATLTFLGGVVGLGLGYGLSSVVAHYAQWPTHISTVSIILSLGVSGVSGLLFGLWPAYEAAKVNPIESLRSE